jgi:alpha-soluble NSF attachment protein
MYLEMGRIPIAARHMKEIAEIYERAGDRATSDMFYRQAADLFRGEELKSDANRCLLQVALFAAEDARYLEAANIYEMVAVEAASNHLLRFSCKVYLQVRVGDMEEVWLRVKVQVRLK